MQKFQVLLRCVKLWARKRGLHCHVCGLIFNANCSVLVQLCEHHIIIWSNNGILTCAMTFSILASLPGFI
jgi:poly(A) polymerase Pap1